MEVGLGGWLWAEQEHHFGDRRKEDVLLWAHVEVDDEI